MGAYGKPAGDNKYANNSSINMIYMCANHSIMDNVTADVTCVTIQ